MPAGTLEVDLIKAHGLKDVEAFGRSDPFAVLVCGGLSHRSRTIHDGGSNPVWNQGFIFEIPDGPTDLHIAIFDEEKHGEDEKMGTTLIPLTTVFSEHYCPPSSYKVEVPSGGRTQGELEVQLKFVPKVPHGTLEVHLIDAHGLLDTDFFSKPDPYAVVYCLKESQKSKVLEGTNPVWDQKFNFNIDTDVTEIVVKLFDEDAYEADDPLGVVAIPVKQALSKGFVEASKYPVLGKIGEPQGEIHVALNFIPKV